MALLLADGISRTGNAVTTVAVPLLALAMTGSAFATGIAGVFATAPIVLGGGLGGTLVDRIGWRRAGIAADAASGITSIAIPVLAGLDWLSFPLLLALVFLSNLLDTPGSTARTAQLPELAELAGAPLSRVMSAHAIISRSAGMIGVGLAGSLVATVGAANALAATAVFAVSIALTAAFVPPDARDTEARADEPREPYLRELAAGVGFVVRTPLVRAIVLLVVLTNMVDAAGMTVLKPVWAERLGDGGAALGAMLAVFAGGALAGAALYGILGDRVPRRVLLVVLFLLAGPPPYVALALGAPLPVVLVILALAGLAAGPLNPLLETALFGIIPVAMRARVLGTVAAGVAAGMPVGSALAGSGVEQLGLMPTLAVAAALYLGVILATAFGRRWRGF